MDERVRFVGHLLDGEKKVALCREFAISRKTGYKIFNRYKEYGLEALIDRSRRPWRYANQLPQQVEAAILNLKREKPYWGVRTHRVSFVLNDLRRCHLHRTRSFAGCSAPKQALRPRTVHDGYHPACAVNSSPWSNIANEPLTIVYGRLIGSPGLFGQNCTGF